MNKYYHSTLRDAKTKLLVIAITTAAIIAEVTTITMSAATPASALQHVFIIVFIISV
jgi:hypothetical protein